MKNNKLKSLEMLAAICFWMAFYQPLNLAAQGDPLIEPGGGVGVLRLGMTMEEVRERVPNRPSNEGLIEPSKEFVQIYNDLGMKLYFVNNILERILIVNPKLRVQGSGIHVGDKSSRVRADSHELERLGVFYHLSPNRRTIVAIEVRRPRR